MEILKKIGKWIFYPHIIVMLVLLPISIALLTYSIVFWDNEAPTAMASYALATYTLTIWCMKIPNLVTYVNNFKNNNPYTRRWTQDAHFRVNISLYGTFIWNTAYAVFQFCLGLYHSSFWYYSLAAYYIFLAWMRYYLSQFTRKNKPGEKLYEELLRYRTCGWIFLAMNLALTLIIFFMVYWNRSFKHHEITTIAMATYTFITFTFAIINVVKYRKYKSPIFSASKAISLAAACVSILTLEATMLTTFGAETTALQTRRLLLGTSGCVISLFIIIMAIHMIVHSSKTLKLLKNQTKEG